MTTATVSAAPPIDEAELDPALPAVATELPPATASNYGDASLLMDPATFEHVQRVAKVYANSDIVPAQYHGNVANCIIAMEIAARLKVNVFMFMQASYVVQGRPGMEAKLAIALINQRGPFRGPIQYDIQRDNKGLPIACTARANHKNGEVCEATVDMELVKAEGWLSKGGSKWKTMPEQMFCYRSAMFLARRYCPEVLMGMPTTDELEDVYGDTRYVASTAAPAHGDVQPQSLSDALDAADTSAPASAPDTEAPPYDQLIHALMDRTGAEADAAAGAIDRALQAQEIDGDNIRADTFTELSNRIKAGDFDKKV